MCVAGNMEDPTASRDDIVDIARSLARPRKQAAALSRQTVSGYAPPSTHKRQRGAPFDERTKQGLIDDPLCPCMTRTLIEAALIVHEAARHLHAT